MNSVIKQVVIYNRFTSPYSKNQNGYDTVTFVLLEGQTEVTKFTNVQIINKFIENHKIPTWGVVSDLSWFNNVACKIELHDDAYRWNQDSLRR